MKTFSRFCMIIVSVAFALSSLAQGAIANESESFASAKAVLVPPVAKDDTTNLIDIGVFETDGYSKLTLNLAGESTDVLRNGGTVGAMLIPAVEPYERAFRHRGLLPSSLEIAVALAAGGQPEFMAKQVRVDAGFPRYRVLLYNTTSNAANITFSVYRSNE